MQSTGLRRWLNRLNSRSELTDADRATVLAFPGQPLMVKANRDYVRLGDEVTCTYLVDAGISARYSQDRKGDRQASAIFLSGDISLDSVMLPDACCSLTALTDVELYCIPHDAVRHAFRASNTLAEALWRDMAVDASIARKWVLNISRHDATTRLAHFICEMALRSQATGRQRDCFAFPVTQAHLADLLGLTPVHVNRVLRVLREAGLVEVDRTEVRILDWPGLAAAGQFEPAYLHIRTV